MSRLGRRLDRPGPRPGRSAVSRLRPWLAGAACLLLAPGASARTLRVNPDGSAAFYSVAQALEKARTGDVLAVQTSSNAVGIELDERDGRPTILRVLPHLAAAEAGLEPLDQILAVDGKDTRGMGSWAAAERLEGEPGTEVRLEARREGWRKPKTFVLKRGFGVWRLQSDFDKGAAAEDNLRYEAAAALWLPLAQRGDAKAQEGLGRLYATGRGVDLDSARALGWFRKAAEQGDPSAMADLGEAYERGAGAEPDPRQALHWFAKAAAQGNARAQRRVARAFRDGSGVEKNPVAAAHWWLQAAEQGEAEAQNELARLYLLGAGVAQDDREALRWFRKAADQGHAEAAGNLGLMSERGRGAARDMTRALEWYARAARRGDARARRRLEELRWRQDAYFEPPNSDVLGAAVEPAHGAFARDVKASGGWYVLAVVAGSPADQAGLAPGDLLTAADGEPLPASGDLAEAFGRWSGSKPGVTLRVERGDKVLEPRLAFSRPSEAAEFVYKQPPGAGRGRRYVVSPKGDGDFRTVHGALAAARPGDELVIRPGDYGAVNVFRDGVTLRAEKRGVKVSRLYLGFARRGATLEGLDVLGRGKEDFSGVLALRGSRDISLRGIGVEDFTQGVTIMDSPGPVDILAARVRDCRIGVAVSSSAVSVRRSLFVGNEEALYLAATRAAVEKNTLVGPGSKGAYGALAFEGRYAVDFRDNIVTGYPAIFSLDAADVDALKAVLRRVRLEYNDLRSSRAEGLSDDFSPTNIAVDPVFKDPSGGDYHPRAGSAVATKGSGGSYMGALPPVP